MQSPYTNLWRAPDNFTHPPHNLSRFSLLPSFSSLGARKFSACPSITCGFGSKSREPGNGSRERMMVKQAKENVWSLDNEAAAAAAAERTRGRRGKGKRGRRVTKRKRIGDGFMVSGAMLVEDEKVLQTQEPVIRPSWQTFTSSLSGIWKGMGAVFSPITAEMEPIDVGKKNEHLFDCYTLSHVELEVASSPSGGQETQINRRINWVTLNPYGEVQHEKVSVYRHDGKSEDRNASPLNRTYNLPKFNSYNFGKSDVMEEDIMKMEPGLVFFEDGSYSRGPVDIPVSDHDGSNYFLSPVYKFEQCLVKGCHRRLRIVHTIEFGNGGSDIQIMRVAVYEEQWDSPASIPDESGAELDMQPFSQRRRVKPSELTGSWKVFEVSATPVYSDDITVEETNGAPYVYLCTETLKKRSLPESAAYFGEEEMLDMQDVTVLWLPGGVTSYVDVKKDGILCIGVGWYSDEGMNLVMERDYGTDGKLKEVRCKSEMKRRWSNPPPM